MLRGANKLPTGTVSSELTGMLSLFGRPRMLMLAPLFVYSNFFYAYQFTAYNSALFNARTQGLNNAAYWSARLGAVYIKFQSNFNGSKLNFNSARSRL